MPSNTSKSVRNAHLKDLFLLFAIPIAIAIFAAAVIYIPRLLANPRYDFIYSTCDDYRCGTSYIVDGNGTITQDSTGSLDLTYYDRSADLRYYDAANDSTRTITLEEARKYRLDTSSKSPDGYTLTRENSSGGFLFGSGDNAGWYLKNGAKKKKVELTTADAYYSRDIKLLGWIDK